MTKEDRPTDMNELKLPAGARLLTQVHANYNLLVALGIKVTNFDPIAGEVINFAALPLLPDYSPYKELPFLELWIRPFNQMVFRIEDAESEPGMQRQLFQKARHIGIDPSMGAELFVNWFENLGLTRGKKMIPICHNYAKFFPIMERWLGPETYKYLFDWRYRDTMLAAGTVNDLCYWRGEAFPYPKYELGSIATRSGASWTGGKYAIEVAMATAATYRGIMGMLR